MTDFTKYQIGERVGVEIVVACPYCGRNSVKREVTISFLHVIRITKGERFEVVLDSCPKDELGRQP
ncbi:MAG: hypothetical protein WA715_10605 [Candidatus Acidiferrum sp.]|jgi:hypothetical protein